MIQIVTHHVRMVRRTSKPPAAPERNPLLLTPRELEDLDRLRSPGPERSALAELSGTQLDGDVAEPVLLHAVIAAGLRVVREAAEARAYAQAALERSAQQEKDRKAARRKRPATADKELGRNRSAFL
jgi:hypothetical protein